MLLAYAGMSAQTLGSRDLDALCDGPAAGLSLGGVMSALLVGYARVSTYDQDLTAQRDALGRLGVSADRIYVDHGLTGTNRERPGLREALAACRGGDTLVVTKLDRLARSLPDAREILEDLTRRKVKLSIGGSVHDPTDPSVGVVHRAGDGRRV